MDQVELPFIDIAFSEQLSLHESHHHFLSYLLAASRKGFLFVSIKEHEVKPPLNEVFEEIPYNFKVEIPQHPLPEGIVQDGCCYYLERYYVAKKNVFKEWQRLSNAKVNPISPSLIHADLNGAQKEAVVTSLKSPTLILTGGPGTGKTYTAALIVKTILDSLSVEERKDFEIAITAPTGKAALNLLQALSNSISTTTLQAKTIHSLLGLKKEVSQYREIPILPFDLIIIDEASMIGVELMETLLSSIKTGAKVILIGDPFQLPPVDGAEILKPLLLEAESQVELKECKRVDRKELLQIAEEVKNNLAVKATLDNISKNELFLQFLNKYSFLPDEDCLNNLKKFCILTPLRKGALGSILINEWFLKHLPKNKKLAIPIIISENDYRFDLFNGELGVVITENPYQFDVKDSVYFPLGKTLPALLLPRFEYAFSLTVHKSQGSEFDEVLLVLPEKLTVSKELLYTAVTRARKKLDVWQGN